MSSRDFFKGKRIAVIGLGPQGEMTSDIKFLIKAGAIVSVYDLRSESRVKEHINALREVGLASYVCGSIPADDLLDMNLILLSYEYPRDSMCLAQAQKAKIKIEYPETLFFKLSPPVTVVGVMGSCGKSTVVSMLAPMLQTVAKEGEQNFFTIDPETDDGILVHLKKIKSGDIILIRMIETMVRELHTMHISPNVAVFTTVPPKGAYVKSPFEIVAYQTYNNFIVANDSVIDATHTHDFQPKAKMLRTKASLLPVDWEFFGRGIHDRNNASLAIQVAQLFKVNEDIIRGTIEKWKPLRGRIELVKKVKNVEFYNDTASISAASTQAAILALSNGVFEEGATGDTKNIVLIYGGADSDHDYKSLYTMMPKYVRTLILLPGSGTLRERPIIAGLENVEICAVASVEEAVNIAYEKAVMGKMMDKDKKSVTRVLFSPSFGAGGLDRSRKERGERFVKAVRLLK